MNALTLRRSALLATTLVFALTACSGLKMPEVSLPKLKMPALKMPDIKVPFVGDDGTAPANDPLVPYSLKQTLTTGHTLEITAYAGQRSPAKIFNGTVMVGEDGTVDLGKFGKLKLAGRSASQAVVELEGAFRRKRSESLISVQLKRIEDTPLLQVSGAVAHRGVVQYFDGANVVNVLPYAGGRSARATGRAVYVTRDGVRKFYPDYGTAEVDLQSGDIVTYSDDL